MLSCTSCQFAILNFRCSVWTNRIRPALHVGGARAGPERGIVRTEVVIGRGVAGCGLSSNRRLWPSALHPVFLFLSVSLSHDSTVQFILRKPFSMLNNHFLFTFTFSLRHTNAHILSHTRQVYQTLQAQTLLSFYE